ncbi:hypothetical protein TNCV_3252141 [Trichonephila clavipes]|nr:hypothetical protein TNCV_3252141 [Trichonephila clavipes]
MRNDEGRVVDPPWALKGSFFNEIENRSRSDSRRKRIFFLKLPEKVLHIFTVLIVSQPSSSPQPGIVWKSLFLEDLAFTL